jgi:hypothetical protein
MIAQINADIQKINDIINAIKNNSAVGAAGTPTLINSVIPTASGNSFDPLPCISGASGCQSVSSMLIGSPGFNSLPLSVQHLTAPVAKLGDALNGATSLSATTLSAAGQIAGSVNALQAGLLKRQNNLQGLLNRSGQNINLAKEITNFGNRLTGITNNGLTAANISARDMNGMMGGAGALGANAHAKTDSMSAAADGKSKSGSAGNGAGAGTTNGLLLGQGSGKGAGSLKGAGALGTAAGTSAIASSDKPGVDALSSAEKAVYDTLSEADKAAFLAMTVEERAAFMAMSPAERAAFLAMTAAERAAFLLMTPEERAAFMAMNKAQRAAYLLARLKARKDVNADDGYSLFEVITNRYKKSAYPRLLKKVKE